MITLFKRIDIFKGFSEKQLAGLSRLFTTKRISKGAFLFEKGSVSDGLIIIHRGEFEVKSDIGTALLKQGDVLGALSLVKETRHKLSPKATRPGEVFILTRAHYGKLVENSPKFALMFQQQVFQTFIAGSESMVQIYLEGK